MCEEKKSRGEEEKSGRGDMVALVSKWATSLGLCPIFLHKFSNAIGSQCHQFSRFLSCIPNFTLEVPGI